MKTEYKIAKENVKEFKNPFPNGIEGNPWTAKIREGVKRDIKESMVSHKATCQRWLDWIGLTLKGCSERGMYKKITDLKQAIKHYEKNGI